MARYTAEGILLDGKPTIRVCEGTRLVGYFRRVEEINDHGLPVDLADVEIKDDTSRK